MAAAGGHLADTTDFPGGISGVIQQLSHKQPGMRHDQRM
jgi:hypothetical protein